MMKNTPPTKSSQQQRKGRSIVDKKKKTDPVQAASRLHEIPPRYARHRAMDRCDVEELNILCDGLRRTYIAMSLHEMTAAEEMNCIDNERCKLEHMIGQCGTEFGEFRCPRALAFDELGTIYVADTENHRVQQFTKSLYPVSALGSYGSAKGKLNEPTGIAISRDSRHAIVADSRNRRLQIFKLNKTCPWAFVRAIKTVDEPYSVAVDGEERYLVGTMKRTVEVYSSDGELLSRFLIGDPETWLKRAAERSMINVQSSLSDYLIDEVPEICQLGLGVPLVVVSDVADREIIYYTYNGYLLHGFEPNSYSDGYKCAVPKAIDAKSAEESAAAKRDAKMPKDSIFGRESKPVVQEVEYTKKTDDSAISLRCSNGGIFIHPYAEYEGEILVCDPLNHTLTLHSAAGKFKSMLLNPRDDLGPVQAAVQPTPGNIFCIEHAQNGRHCLKFFAL